MSGFKFRLERVLHWRSVECAAEETRLKQLIEEQVRLETQRADVRAERTHIASRIASMEDLHGADLAAAANYASHLTAEHRRVAQRCRDNEKQLAEQVNKHRAAKQRYELLEALRERQYSEWRVRADREADEVALESYLSRWGRPE